MTENFRSFDDNFFGNFLYFIRSGWKDEQSKLLEGTHTHKITAKLIHNNTIMSIPRSNVFEVTKIPPSSSSLASFCIMMYIIVITVIIDNGIIFLISLFTHKRFIYFLAKISLVLINRNIFFFCFYHSLTF